jgi:hypothetical protein
LAHVVLADIRFLVNLQEDAKRGCEKTGSEALNGIEKLCSACFAWGLNPNPAAGTGQQASAFSLEVELQASLGLNATGSGCQVRGNEQRYVHRSNDCSLPAHNLNCIPNKQRRITNVYRAE